MRVPVGARRSGVADGYGQDQAAREKDRDASVGERGDIREEKERKRQGSGREGCGSTHRDRLNSRAARLFFRPPPPPSFRAPPRRDAMSSPRAEPCRPAVPPLSFPPLLAFLFSVYPFTRLDSLLFFFSRNVSSLLCSSPRFSRVASPAPRPLPPLAGSSINVGSPLTANHHFQFSVVQRASATFFFFFFFSSSSSPLLFSLLVRAVPPRVAPVAVFSFI